MVEEHCEWPVRIGEQWRSGSRSGSSEWSRMGEGDSQWVIGIARQCREAVGVVGGLGARQTRRAARVGGWMHSDLLVTLFAAAAEHGRESDADHEVGDLQEILRSCWARLTPEKRREIYAEHLDVVTSWLRD